MRVRVPLPAPPFASAMLRVAGHKKVLGVRRSWRAGADCKSVGLSLRWFESTHSHQKHKPPEWVVFVFGYGFDNLIKYSEFSRYFLLCYHEKAIGKIPCLKSVNQSVSDVLIGVEFHIVFFFIYFCEFNISVPKTVQII